MLTANSSSFPRMSLDNAIYDEMSQSACLTQRYVTLLHTHECGTGKYTTHKIHTKLPPDPAWRVINILTSGDINDVISRFFTVVHANIQFDYAMKKKTVHGGLNKRIIFSRVKNNIFLARCARS